MKVRVHLSIGFPSATRSDIIDVDDDEWNDCGTQEEKEDLIHEYWKEWADNYIECGHEIIE